MEINIIDIDCSKMSSRETAHEYLMQVFSFPSYYGKNLDALFDCLQEIPPCQIRLLNQESLDELGRYGEGILDVFRDVAEQVPWIELIEGKVI